MIKTWFVALPLLCAVNVAMADSVAPEGPADKRVSTAAPAKSAPHYRSAHKRIKRLPSGDIRHCLDLKTNADIIRCSEIHRRK